MLEVVTPRACAPCPVSKACSLPLAVAARCMAGRFAGGAGVHAEIVPPYYSGEEAVLPFVKFPSASTPSSPGDEVHRRR